MALSRARLAVLPPPEFLTGYAYLRVSSEEQSKGESVPNQAPSCVEIARRQGIQVIACFFDNPHTGKEVYGRRGWEACIEAAQANGVGVVIARDTARLHRNDDEFREYERRVIKPAKIRLLTGEGWRSDQTTSEYVTQRSMDMAVTVYSRMIGDSTRDGKHQARLRGYWPDGCPDGYRRRGQQVNGQWLSASDRELIPDPQRAPIIREIKDRLLAGESHDSIAGDLTAREIPGPRGGPWYESTLFYIAANPLYAGLITYRGKVLLNREAEPVMLKGEPLWDVATYDALRPKGKPAVRAREDRYIFAGLLVTSHFVCTSPKGRLGQFMPLMPKSQTKNDTLWYKPAHTFERLYSGEIQDELAPEFPAQLDARVIDAALMKRVIAESKHRPAYQYEEPDEAAHEYYERKLEEYRRAQQRLLDAKQLRDNAVKLMMQAEALEYRERVRRLEAEVEAAKRRKMEAGKPLFMSKRKVSNYNGLELAHLRGDVEACRRAARDMIDYIDVRVTGPWFVEGGEQKAPLRFEIHWRQSDTGAIKAESPEERAVSVAAAISSCRPLRLHTGKRGRPRRV